MADDSGQTPFGQWLTKTFAPPAVPIAKALSGQPQRPANDGHTTSGLDAAMQKHADQVHPVPKP